ncbi:MAG: S26 family signal peptidase, partial [Pirellulaceae bacterium]|nr:S26 family signal peptidase [Pirellulaceae bacterium]
NDGMMIVDSGDWDNSRFGGNWVGDLVMEAKVTVGPQGKLALDAVEGGVHFLCEIDVATGQATLSTEVSPDGVAIQFAGGSPTSLQFETPLKGAGSYQIRFANCDDRIYLWINDQEVTIPGDGCYARSGKLAPFYHVQDYGDARPLGIGFQGGSLSVERLKVFRDFYYLGKDDFNFAARSSLRDRRGLAPNDLQSLRKMYQYYETPTQWTSAGFRDWYEPFDQQLPLNWDEAYLLTEDQFFPMGDNSPQSEDARKWAPPKYVERRFMIGRALMVYWPHTWNSPPFWPNFNRMRTIH